MDGFENLRGQAAVLAGIADTPGNAKRVSASVPKLAFVSPPSNYRTEGSNLPVHSSDIHLISRIISNQSFHKAYAVTGAIATASAAVIPGTVVYSMIEGERSPIKIGHPTGVIDCAVKWSNNGNETFIYSAGVQRTARCIAEVQCYLPNGVF